MATDRLKEEFVIACEVEVFPTGTRVAQFTKTFVAKRCLIKREAIVKQEVFVNKKLYPSRCDAIILLTVNLAEEIPKWSRKCLLKGSGLAKEGRGT